MSATGPRLLTQEDMAAAGDVVRLTTAELWQAASVGALRHMQALARGQRDAHGFNGEDGWTIHIEGACGELALAKFLGVYPGLTANAGKAADVGRYQVRTRSKADYDLIVRSGDRDNDVFVLVTGTNGTYRVVGAILGRDAKQSRWRKEYGGRPAAYFVPQSSLLPMSSVVAAA